MLKFFKHSYISQHVVIVIMTIVLWLPAFITKSAFIVGDDNTPLYNAVISLFDFSPFIINTIAFVVYLISVFLFNSVLSANRLVNKYYTVGALTFALMMCSSPDLHLCYPFIFACPFILMAMHTLFLIHQTENPENYMMNIGYFIAIASLFYYPSVFFMLWVFISFVILGFRELRYLLIPLTAFMIINAIVIGITYLSGDINGLIESYSLFFKDISFSFNTTLGNKIFFMISLILFLISLAGILGNRNSDNGTNFRKRIGVGIVLTILSLLIFFINQPVMGNILIYMMFAFFYAIMLSNVRKSMMANIAIILMLLIILTNQYLPLFGITI